METIDNKNITKNGRPYYKGITKEEKTNWITALRSGDYKQCVGVGYSAETNSYCCLGVLAKIVGEDAALEWSIILSDRGDTNILYDKNDREQLSFVEIADYIEANINTID